ncbi:MAG: DUF177 domain-containing protein [Deltaproteobacteria bacterium]|nr:DUF177 domain-containing protein [Candidatus Zymogenaceae bacterium]
MDSLRIHISEIPVEPDGGYSVAFPGEGRFAEWRENFTPLAVHTVIPGTDWQAKTLSDIVESGLSFPHGFEGAITLVTSGNDIFVSGRIQLLVVRECGRCLESFEAILDVPFSYIITRMNVQEREHELSVDELEQSFLHGDEVDIAQIIEEQVALALPMRPLCSELCSGLCPQCGGNLNKKQCDCDQDVVDVRFEKLKDFQVK